LAEHERFDAALVGIRLSSRAAVPTAAVLEQRRISFAIMTGRPVEQLPDVLRGRRCLVKPFRTSDVKMLLPQLLSDN
jgi:hypothetical protein